MLRINRMFTMLLLVALILGACQPIQPVTSMPANKLDDVTVAKIEGIIQKAMTDYPTPGFTLCIVKDGQVVYSKGFGMADVASQHPMTPISVSTEYSIAKSMTAMAVMQLVEQGKVNLDEPVTTYLPYFTMADARYQAITVRMLLNHTSGMPDDPWNFALTGDADPLEQAVRSLSSKSLLDAPGAAWSYADVGFDILGDLIAKVSGESFPIYMKEHLLKPLGMLTSTFVRAEVDSALRVTGYVDGEGEGVTAGEANFDARNAPAANLYSNCAEMAQWAIVMLNQGKAGEKQLLTTESIEAMWTNGVATPWRDIVGPWYGGAFQTYSLGWHLGSMDGHRLVGNAGSADGFNTQMQLAPDDGLAVIAMNNWLTYDTATWYPASFAAIDVMYTLLGITPE